MFSQSQSRCLLENQVETTCSGKFISGWLSAVEKYVQDIREPIYEEYTLDTNKG